jgi:hypothetical protein
MKKVHMCDTRLRNNGGLDYPVCYVNLKRGLDLDKSRLHMTGNFSECTCERCKKMYRKLYPDLV